jgi:hypothetical protein
MWGCAYHVTNIPFNQDLYERSILDGPQGSSHVQVTLYWKALAFHKSYTVFTNDPWGRPPSRYNQRR